MRQRQAGGPTTFRRQPRRWAQWVGSAKLMLALFRGSIWVILAHGDRQRKK